MSCKTSLIYEEETVTNVQFLFHSKVKLEYIIWISMVTAMSTFPWFIPQWTSRFRIFLLHILYTQLHALCNINNMICAVHYWKASFICHVLYWSTVIINPSLSLHVHICKGFQVSLSIWGYCTTLHRTFSFLYTSMNSSMNLTPLLTRQESSSCRQISSGMFVFLMIVQRFQVPHCYTLSFRISAMETDAPLSSLMHF